MIKIKFGSREYRALCSLLILICIISVSGCKSTMNMQSTDVIPKETSAAFPLTITDDLGRKVSINTEAKRIVSLAPSNTEILFYLGLGDRVAGDTTYCIYPEEAKLVPKIGGFRDPSLEKIVALKPDLVLATDMHQPLIKGLEDAGLNVLVLNPHTIDGIMADIQLIGSAAGVENKANDLTAGLKNRVNAVTTRVEKVPENQRPTVYYEMWNEPLMSIGRDSLIGQMIKLAGGISITDDCIEQYPQISEEVILERNPQVMINSYGHGSREITPAEIAARKGWKEISFVKNNSIYTIDTDLLTLPGPRIVDGLEKMAALLQPELFK